MRLVQWTSPHQICILWGILRLASAGGGSYDLPSSFPLSMILRTCVGVTFASQSLFIDFSLLLWAFNIEKARDAQGNEILPSLTDVVDGGVTV